MKKLKIRTRLVLLYTAVLMLLLVCMFAAVYWFFSRVLYSNAENRIQEYAKYVADEIELDDGLVEVDLADDDIEDIYRECLISVYSLDGELIEANHETGWLAEIPRKDGQTQRVDEGLHWQIYDVVVRDDGEDIAWLRLAMPLENIIDVVGELRGVFLLGVPFCLMLSILSGLWITRRVLVPIQKITQTAREIGQGDLSKRLDFEAGKDEIAELAATFDQMLDNLEAAFSREKQFSSDASHELRTPIAVIMAHSEEALQDPEATEESYRASLAVIGEKARDMQRMLSQLLMLARGYEQGKTGDMVELDLGMAVEDIAMEMLPEAQKKNIEIQLELEKGLSMKADLMLFTRMLMNLIENGIKYGREKGFIRISLHRWAGERGKEEIELLVQDNGQGIGPEDLPHVFERFYRSDKARSGEGFGLGLSLVKWIAELHGGRIGVDSKEGEGTRFSLRFPARGSEAQ